MGVVDWWQFHYSICCSLPRSLLLGMNEQHPKRWRGERSSHSTNTSAKKQATPPTIVRTLLHNNNIDTAGTDFDVRPGRGGRYCTCSYFFFHSSPRLVLVCWVRFCVFACVRPTATNHLFCFEEATKGQTYYINYIER